MEEDSEGTGTAKRSREGDVRVQALALTRLRAGCDMRSNQSECGTKWSDDLRAVIGSSGLCGCRRSIVIDTIKHRLVVDQ